MLIEKENCVLQTIYARRSVRRFLEKAVEPEKVTQLLKAAMAAPSACNIQPWEFIVVEDSADIAQIKASIPRYADYNTPLVLVVCGNPRFIPWKNDVGTLDCAAAIENILLAATAMDLGSVWIGGFDPDALRRILQIPEDVFPIGVVYIGYPAFTPPPRTQYKPELVHYGRYDTAREYRKKPEAIV